MQVLGSPAIAAAAERIAVRAWSPEVAAWIRRGVPRHVRRGDARLLSPARTKRAAALAVEAEGLSLEARDRVLRALSDGDRVWLPHPARLEAFVAEACDMVDWLTSLPREDRHIKRIDRMSVADALEMSRRWHERFAELEAAEADAAELADGVRTVHEWPDGVRMVQLGSPGALRAEGNAMGHCVGGYWDRVASGTCRIFSLRDADGFPHVTIEVGRLPLVTLDDGSKVFLATVPRPGVNRIAVALNDAVVQQVQGKGNKPPVPRWAGYGNAFLRERGWSTEILSGTKAVDVYSTGGRHFGSPSDAVRHLAANMSKASRRERSVRRAMPPEAMSIAAACPPEDRAAFDRKFVGMAFARDFAEPFERKLLAVGTTSLRMRFHRLPLGSMEVVAASLGGTHSETAFERVRSGLSAFLDAVSKDAGAVHGYDLPPGCGLTPSVVSDLFLVSGLHARREEARAANRAGLEAVARSMRDELRVDATARRKGRESMTQERANLVANLVAGDAVRRFTNLAGSAALGLGFQSFLPTDPPARRVAVAKPAAPPPPAVRGALPAVFARFR